MKNENGSEISDQNENVRFTFLRCTHNAHLNSTRILEVKTVLKSADLIERTVFWVQIEKCEDDTMEFWG